MNEQLLNYIKENLARGVPRKEIKNSLLASGWKNEDVDSGFLQLESSPPPTATEPDIQTQSPKTLFNIKFLLAVLILVVLVIGGVGAYFFLSQKTKLTKE